MAEPKTKATRASVKAFLGQIKDPEARRDCATIDRIMRQATGARPVMWGPSIVGYGNQPVRSSSGKMVDWPVVGFSPRKAALSIYLMASSPRRAALLKRLGKHKTGVSCLYVRRVSDVNLEVLEALVRDSVAASAGGATKELP